jgi:hypothetical protein
LALVPAMAWRTSSSGAQTEQMLGIAVSELCKVICTEDIRQTVEKSPAARVGAVGVIDGEEKAIDADHLKGAAQRRHGKTITSQANPYGRF